jgi:hypothetical protein
MLVVRSLAEEIMKKTIVSVWLFLACAAAWALPTVQQVEAEVQQGHYSQAESMMREVVDAKPTSAKGHYIYAEILAHNGSFAKAAEEAAKAKSLDPAIKFTQPDKFQAFETLLEREQRPAPRVGESNSVSSAAVQVAPSASQAGGIPSWVWGAALALAAYFLWRGFSRSRATQATGGAPSFAGSAQAYAPGAPGTGGVPAPYAGTPTASPMSSSSGLLGTGLAVAGGVAAGMLVDEMLHRHQGTTGTDQFSGLQRGVIDAPPTDNAAKELENRNVDFGNGADWDSGGNAADSGGGGSDDGGWG